jgi:hypothetical protein
MVASLQLEDKMLVQEGCSVVDISTLPPNETGRRESAREEFMKG